jgi:hypothetical protein
LYNHIQASIRTILLRTALQSFDFGRFGGRGVSKKRQRGENSTKYYKEVKIEAREIWDCF